MKIATCGKALTIFKEKTYMLMTSKMHLPIMFADDINLFYTHSNIKKLFPTMDEELASINQWFTSNKLSLNAKKTKYSFFHKPS